MRVWLQYKQQRGMDMQANSLLSQSGLKDGAVINLKYIYMENFKPSYRYLKKCKGKRKMQNKKKLPYTDQSQRFIGGGTYAWEEAKPMACHNGGTVFTEVNGIGCWC